MKQNFQYKKYAGVSSYFHRIFLQSFHNSFANQNSNINATHLSCVIGGNSDIHTVANIFLPLVRAIIKNSDIFNNILLTLVVAVVCDVPFGCKRFQIPKVIQHPENMSYEFWIIRIFIPIANCCHKAQIIFNWSFTKPNNLS